MSDLAVAVRVAHKSYRMGSVDLHVLRGVSFSVSRGEFVSIVGASGSGKSTLLHLVGLLDRPDKGTVALDGVDTGGLSKAKRNHIRCNHVGFVFQFYHLLPELSVLENTLLPARVAASVPVWLARGRAMRTRAVELLSRLGLKERLKHRPRELSGGERQRVALARALMNSPDIILADEPTGNLDSTTGGQIMDLLEEFNRKNAQTILMVTHDSSLADRAHRKLHLKDGKLA